MKEGADEGVLGHSCSYRCTMKIRKLIFLAACFGPQTAVLSVGTRGRRGSAFEASALDALGLAFGAAFVVLQGQQMTKEIILLSCCGFLVLTELF